MEIREAKETDIPEIVEVLKASLGEDQLELSQEVWRYKHINNPYGKSIVLIALEGEKIIGVRALMRWGWQRRAKKFSALRAVDTATDPAHQGKGVFRKLTLKAVDIAKSRREDFIFNTPNEKSRPGYLKMGWEEVGKIYIGLKPSLSFLKFKRGSRKYNINKRVSMNDLDQLCFKWNKYLQTQSGLFAPKTAEILKWRYEENPLQTYEVIAEKEYYLAAYIKRRGKLKEFRIAEFIYDKQLLNKKDIKRIISKLVSKYTCHIISFSPCLLGLNAKKGNLGPILTFNALNVIDREKEDLLKISNWNNSLGDLELF